MAKAHFGHLLPPLHRRPAPAPGLLPVLGLMDRPLPDCGPEALVLVLHSHPRPRLLLARGPVQVPRLRMRLGLLRVHGLRVHGLRGHDPAAQVLMPPRLPLARFLRPLRLPPVCGPKRTQPLRVTL